MTLETATELRAALRDPVAALESPAARLAYALRAELVERVDRAFTAAGLSALLVKGAGLALTVYPRPWLRPMCDVDLVVRRSERPAALAALTAAGFAVEPPPAGRRLTADALDEVQLGWGRGATVQTLEIHTGLDKLVSRPVPWPAIRARAVPAPGLAALRVPALEDHLLLVALHAAGAELRHPVAYVDLELMLRARPSAPTIVARAGVMRLRTAAWVALRTLRALGAPSADAALEAALRPRLPRRLAVGARYDLDAYPFARSPSRPGLPWALWQTVVRDDLGAWLAGLARYGARRARERWA